MITAYYAHRLPGDYDLGIIRERARKRGSLWDDVPNLHFKAFLLREAGKYGAAESSYSSFYLWRNDQGFADFLQEGRYQTVVSSFGRASIETRLVLDAVRGPDGQARFLSRQEQDIPRDAQLQEVLAQEVERHRERARQPGVMASVVSVDPKTWRLSRVQLLENEIPQEGTMQIYQVLYLARPLFDGLPGL